MENCFFSNACNNISKHLRSKVKQWWTVTVLLRLQWFLCCRYNTANSEHTWYCWWLNWLSAHYLCLMSEWEMFVQLRLSILCHTQTKRLLLPCCLLHSLCRFEQTPMKLHRLHFIASRFSKPFKCSWFDSVGWQSIWFIWWVPFGTPSAICPEWLGSVAGFFPIW